MALPDFFVDKGSVLDWAKRQLHTVPEKEGRSWRRRSGRGGGIELHVSCLPDRARIKLFRDAAPDVVETPREALERSELWRWFDGLSNKKKAEAQRRLNAITLVEQLAATGRPLTSVVPQVARQVGIAPSGIYRWRELVYGVRLDDRLPTLAPRHAGRPGEAECTPEAWEMFAADYLRPEKPNLTDCYDRVVRTGRERGWTVPSRTTLGRRIDAMPPQVVVLAREGAEALKRLYPAQERDRSMFHALEAVNADGHKWDLFVAWPDGTVGRPQMVVFQDLYSGMMLSWRVDQTANKEAVRLAFGDMVSTWGIPDHCWLDNGRDFASKWITGGTPNRYRFKVRDEDPAGILTALRVEVHWTTPYSGQSKPIERGFRDFAQSIAKHPAFAGAYAGNTPVNKPDNYGARAVPLETFLQVVAGEIAAHNDRVGRRSRVCGGRLSFSQAFAASYAASPIRRATPEQARLWLLAAEALRVDRRDGTIRMEGNRYWTDLLLPLRGQSVVARFDPQSLQDDLHIYRTDGAYLGRAQCVEAAGFADVDAARAHGRARRTWMRASRELLDAERRLTIDQVAAMLPAPAEPAPAPETKVVRPLFAGNAALKVRPDEDEETDDQRRLARVFELQRPPVRLLEAVPDGGDGE